MKHLIPEFEKLRERFPAGFESSLVLPCLRRIQEDRGYVADSDIEELAAYLGVPQIQIEEVLSFYTQFRRKPIGRWHLQFCHNVSCSMNGAERVLAHVEQRLGIKPGRDHAGRTLHAVHRRVPRLLRHRADDDGERRLPREPDAARSSTSCWRG